MPAPKPASAHSFFSAPKVRRVFAHFGREVLGVAQDYWKDGNWGNPPQPVKHHAKKDAPKWPAHRPEEEEVVPFEVAKTKEGLWHAQPGEISERMWGKGHVTPADDYISELLIMPLGLTKEMSLLDLSAGLGQRMRRVTDDFGVYINGREPDPEIAARGMAMSVAAGLSKRAAIEAYDPMNLIETRNYDCVVARETIYRVANKEKFIRSIVGLCKERAQVSFTDYIVNPEVRGQPAIRAWCQHEAGANPAGLVELAGIWAKAGISLRVHDDQTEAYKKAVKLGMLRFAKFMAEGIKPDPETKKTIARRLVTWSHRMAAIEQGMKFYRFYGVR
jgi:cyclopropane fatty-acyl-phospholipid synthase-like methyltransferase